MLKAVTRRRRGKKVFYGWWIVLAGAACNYFVSGGIFFGFGAFFNPIIKEFGWSRAITSIAFSIQRTETGVLAPFTGFLVDRFGPRRIMLAGMFISGAGLILLSQINSLWTFYGAFVIISLGMSFSSQLVAAVAVGNWFVAMRSRALALMSSGAGLGATLVPVLVWLIYIMGWRGALIVLGLAFWTVGIPASLVMRSRPEEYGQLPDGRQPRAPVTEAASPQVGTNPEVVLKETQREKAILIEEVEFTVKEALRTRAFWQLGIAVGFAQLIMSSSNLHQIPALVSFGITEGTAGLVVMLFGITTLLGRGAGGFLGDYVDKRYVLAAALGLLCIGSLIFAGITTTWQLVPYILLFGTGYGGSIPVRFAILADYFGRKSFGSLMGISMTISAVFGIGAPVFAGWIFDVTDSYRPAFVILTLSALLGIPLLLTIKSPAVKIQNGAHNG